MIKICEICGKEYTPKTTRQRQCGADECRRKLNCNGAKVRNRRKLNLNKSEKNKKKKYSTLDIDAFNANKYGISYGRYMAFKKGVAN